MTETHKIETGDNVPKSMAEKPVKYQLCGEHDGERNDWYCFDHRAVICGVCVVRKHKHCDYKHVSEACKRVNISSEENIVSKDADELIKYANSVKKSIDDNINKLNAQVHKTLEDAEVHRDNVIKQIHESYQDFSAEVTNTIQEQKGILSGKKSAIDHIVIDFTSTLPAVQQTTAVKHSDQKRFLDLHDNAEKLSLLLDKTQCLDMKSVEIKHCFNMNIQPLLKSNDKFGDVSVHESTIQCEPLPDIRHSYLSPHQDADKTAQLSVIGTSSLPLLPVKLTRTDNINVKLVDDEKDCLITALDMTVDGNILIADNYKTKLFSHSGKLLSFLKLRERPEYVSVINRSEAAVSMWNKQIGVIDIADSGHLFLKNPTKTISLFEESQLLTTI